MSGWVIKIRSIFSAVMLSLKSIHLLKAHGLTLAITNIFFDVSKGLFLTGIVALFQDFGRNSWFGFSCIALGCSLSFLGLYLLRKDNYAISQYPRTHA